ncbi:hypothetical protein JCM16138_21210 [Thermococcus atlanticus]
MKEIFSVIIIFLLASVMVIGSSGTFVQFTAERGLRMNVTSHDNEYMAFSCIGNYSNTVMLERNSTTTFNALTVFNYLNELQTAWVTLSPDYSDLPGEVTMWIETENGSQIAINPGSSYTFSGSVSVGDVPVGEYVIPIQMFAYWASGDASVSTCPLRLIVVESPIIEKILLEGNTTVPTHTYEEWKIRILVTNGGIARNLTVRDTIPNEFDVDLNRTGASTGSYEFVEIGNSNGATKLTWNVSLEAGESAYLDMLVYTKENPAGKQEFTSCGNYSLNDGAEIEELGIKSNSLEVEATCQPHDCCIKVVNGISPGHIKAQKPANLTKTITVINMGAGKDVTLHQNITGRFTVMNYTAPTGNVTLTPLPGGRTEVTWQLHMAHGESRTLKLGLHTDGISIGHRHHKLVMVAGRAWIEGCGKKGSITRVLVKKHCSCHGGSLGDINIEDLNLKEGMGDYE